MNRKEFPMSVYSDLEKQLQTSLSVKAFDWIEVAERLTRIRNENIWRESKATSWTNWIKALSEKTNRHPETYFKIISAYTYYQDLYNQCSTLKELRESEVSKDNIILIKTISKDIHSIGVSLMHDVSSGKYKRRHLKIINNHIGSEWEKNKIMACLKRAEVACLLERRMFFGSRGAKKFYGRTSIKDGISFDCIAMSDDLSPTIHGVVISESEPEELQSYGNYVDHLWIVSNRNDLDVLHGLVSVNLDSDEYAIIKTPDEKGRASKRSQTMEYLLIRGR